MSGGARESWPELLPPEGERAMGSKPRRNRPEGGIDCDLVAGVWLFATAGGDFPRRQRTWLESEAGSGGKAGQHRSGWGFEGSQSDVCTIEQPSPGRSRQPDVSSLKRRSRARACSEGAVIEMEDPRCTIVAMEMEDPRCMSLRSGAALGMEDPRCRIAAHEMEDPRCGSPLMW